MTTHSTQGTLFPVDDGFDEKTMRSLLDHLLTESKLYKTGDAYKALLAFIVRMRNFAPFNAMLIHIQKPGIRFTFRSCVPPDRSKPSSVSPHIPGMKSLVPYRSRLSIRHRHRQCF